MPKSWGNGGGWGGSCGHGYGPRGSSVSHPRRVVQTGPAAGQPAPGGRGSADGGGTFVGGSLVSSEGTDKPKG
jgi:hypothetical protein